MLGWMWGNGNVYSLLAGLQTGAVAMTIGVEDPQRTPNRSATRFNGTILGLCILYRATCSSLLLDSQKPGNKNSSARNGLSHFGLSMGSQDPQTRQVTASAFSYYPELGGKTLQVYHTLEKHHGETSGY